MKSVAEVTVTWFVLTFWALFLAYLICSWWFE